MQQMMESLGKAIAVLVIAAAIEPVDRVIADDRSQFVIDMTHAFYAKVYCPNLDMIYDGFVAAAKAKHLDPAIVEEVRNGVAYLNTNGQAGKRPSKDVEGWIDLAARMVALDHQKSGVEGWCKFRAKFLIEEGFVKPTKATP
jgi:hypothetical protein